MPRLDTRSLPLGVLLGLLGRAKRLDERSDGCSERTWRFAWRPEEIERAKTGTRRPREPENASH
mgnify:CR=1 FL=1